MYGSCTLLFLWITIVIVWNFDTISTLLLELYYGHECYGRMDGDYFHIPMPLGRAGAYKNNKKHHRWTQNLNRIYTLVNNSYGSISFIMCVKKKDIDFGIIINKYSSKITDNEDELHDLKYYEQKKWFETKSEELDNSTQRCKVVMVLSWAYTLRIQYVQSKEATQESFV